MNRPSKDSGATDGPTSWLSLGRAALVAVASVVVLSAGACGNDERAVPAGITPGTTTTTSQPPACIDGAEQECIIFIAEHNGVSTCVHGEQTCIAGQWEDCRAPSTTGRSGEPSEWEPPAGAGMPPTRALSTPVDCVDNPCDPSCQVFDEEPPGGVPTEEELVGTYIGGSLSAIPPGFVNKGHNEPCGGAQDCQFDTYCADPDSDDCAHDKCVVGDALAIGCDVDSFQPTQPECVDAICAADPTCCGLPPGPPGTCSHHPCDEGIPLVSGCDPCITSVCAVDSSCCERPYEPAGCAHTPCQTGQALASGCDSAAANCVASICAANPACCTATFNAACIHSGCTLGNPLTSGCDPCVTAVCAARPQCCTGSNVFSATCAHSPCAAKEPRLSAACDPCVAAVCAARPSCCTANGNAWDATCKALVETECASLGKTCSPSWTQTCADMVATTPACGGMSCSATWSAACAAAVSAAPCSQSCTLGAWDASCVAQAETTCSLGCNAAGGWDAGCVDMVGTVCGAICGGTEDAECTPWLPGQRWSTHICNDVDYTVGPPCTDYLPVCNRGNVEAPAGVVVYIYPGNSSHFPMCIPTDFDADGQCVTTVPIPPGQCINLTEADCTTFHAGNGVLQGNRTAMVNPPIAGQLPECFCENNWSDYHNGGCDVTEIYELVPTVYKQVYEAVCPAGTGVQWGFLSYDTTTPVDSNVVFQAHTADTVANLGNPLTDLATAKATPLPDTQVCLTTGPAPCPIDIYQAFVDDLGSSDGHLAATRPVLELVITLNPGSDLSSGAIVNTWEITYSCVEDE